MIAEPVQDKLNADIFLNIVPREQNQYKINKTRSFSKYSAMRAEPVQDKLNTDIFLNIVP